jgi:hypothetical protein
VGLGRGESGRRTWRRFNSNGVVSFSPTRARSGYADDVARGEVAVAIDFRADAPGFAVAAQRPQRCWAHGLRVSSERRHFCRLSLNVRPMAIASPTIFIRSGDSAERRKRDGDFQMAAFCRKPRRSARTANPGLMDLTPGRATVLRRPNFWRSATVSAGPVAAGGGAQAGENILRCGFANVLRLIPLCGTQPRSNRNAAAAFRPAVARWWLCANNSKAKRGILVTT